ncbi:MAG: GNAT family N-acetyltransferase [Cytophagaceae bacterium]|nr:GNAT family N-acetyltransferase [Cytophagaceae bacterium]
MEPSVKITFQTANTAAARAMLDSLWDEIQRRYEFTAPNPMRPEDFIGPRAGFWLAQVEHQPVGSIRFTSWSEDIAELDAMYVVPEFRGRGIAQQLMSTLETYTRQHPFNALRLRAGEPQPEALRFYEKMGFHRIPCFGKWVADPTAQCFEKQLEL